MLTIYFTDVNYGSGTHFLLVPQERLVMFFILLTTTSLLYFVAIAMCRLAIIAFIPRINNARTSEITDPWQHTFSRNG